MDYLKLVGPHLSVFFFIIMNPNFSSEIIPVLYTGVTNYRCTYCLRQSIKQTILQKPINNVLFNYLFIPSMKTNDIGFNIKLNLLKTLFILGYPSRNFECPLLLITGVYLNKCSRKLSRV